MTQQVYLCGQPLVLSAPIVPSACIFPSDLHHRVILRVNYSSVQELKC